MTSYTVDLTTLEFTHEADAVIVDHGALRFTRGADTSLIIAAGRWKSVRSPDTPPLPRPPVEQPRLPLQPVPDRSRAVAQRLAALDDLGQ
jgi:hypothetical protein